VNTYTVFAELNRKLLSERGYCGCIVPSGIATDDTTKFFFQDITDTGSLVSLYDFENREGIFPGVHRSYKFCLLTLRAPLTTHRLPLTTYQPSTSFLCSSIADLAIPNGTFSSARMILPHQTQHPHLPALPQQTGC
jgi:hypothetical protein